MSAADASSAVRTERGSGNVALWALQVLLALHTAMGAAWKLSNPAAGVASLEAIPEGAWLALAALELFASVGLLLPALRPSLRRLAPLAALFIAAEMALFGVVHLASGHPEHGPLVYWLVVAGLSGALAYGRSAQQRG